MVGCCNGLVCIGFLSAWSINTCFLICNPSTRTYKSILPLSGKKHLMRDLTSSFGYDSEHDDYKIVLTSKRSTDRDRDVLIYSLKSDLWRPATTPNFTGRGRESVQSVVYGNTVLHYLVSGEGNYRVARFDICSEEWRDDLRLPVQAYRTEIKQFSEMDGNIYLCLYNFTTPSVDIWMIEEYGTKDYSWRMVFKLPYYFRRNYVVAISKSERPRLLLHNYIDSFIWYDQQDGTTETFKLDTKQLLIEAELCITSLVSIPGSSSIKMKRILD